MLGHSHNLTFTQIHANVNFLSSKLVKRLKPPLATAETFRSASVDPISRVSPSSNFAHSPPVPAHQPQPTYLIEAIRELEQRPGVRRMELLKVELTSERKENGEKNGQLYL